MFKIVMIVDDSFSRFTARMIVDDKLMIVWMEMSSRTIIDYHAPFDRGFIP